LLSSSNHPKSLFIRLRRICSDIDDFYFFSLKIISYLLARGYNIKTLIKTFNMVLDLDRYELLKYKDKDYNIKENDIIFLRIILILTF